MKMSFEGTPDTPKNKLPVDILEPKEFHKTPRQEQNKLTSDTYTFFKESLIHAGYTEFTQPSEGYGHLPATSLIVRREDPLALLKLIGEKKPYTIMQEENERYENAVEWNPSLDGVKGISNAYSEGRGQLNSVVAVAGILPKNLTVETLEHSSETIQNTDRHNIRSISGTVSPEDTLFISLRVPGHLFPPEEMTEEESEKLFDYEESESQDIIPKIFMVHRTYIAPQLLKIRKTAQ